MYCEVKHTFRVLVVGLFQVLHHTILTNQVLNLPLSFDIEGVFVQQSNLVLTFALGFLCLALPHGECVSPAGGVGEGGSEVWVAAAEVVLGVWIHKELLSHTFWIRLRWQARCSARGPTARWRVSPDHDGEHLAIPYSSILERLCVVGDGLAVEVEALGGGGQGGVGLDEALEVLDGAAGRDLEGQQVLVGLGAGRGDGYGDARPGGGGLAVHFS